MFPGALLLVGIGNSPMVRTGVLTTSMARADVRDAELAVIVGFGDRGAAGRLIAQGDA